MYTSVNNNDEKKPSEIAQGNGVEGRDTGRPTDLKELENQTKVAKDSNSGPRTVCCCIDPYLNEDATPYPENLLSREGDVYKHRVQFKTRVICFNLCYNTENSTHTIIQRASDGAIAKGISPEDLNQVQQYFLVRSEKCNHKHHDLRRLSVMGRMLVYFCTTEGLLSTCKKLCCLEDCVNTVNIETVRCERTLYSRRAY
jgi:hypothetical protein